MAALLKQLVKRLPFVSRLASEREALLRDVRHAWRQVELLQQALAKVQGEKAELERRLYHTSRIPFPDDFQPRLFVAERIPFRVAHADKEPRITGKEEA